MLVFLSIVTKIMKIVLALVLLIAFVVVSRVEAHSPAIQRIYHKSPPPPPHPTAKQTACNWLALDSIVCTTLDGDTEYVNYWEEFESAMVKHLINTDVKGQNIGLLCDLLWHEHKTICLKYSIDANDSFSVFNSSLFEPNTCSNTCPSNTLISFKKFNSASPPSTWMGIEWIGSEPRPNGCCISAVNCANIIGCGAHTCGGPILGFQGQNIIAQYFTDASIDPTISQSSFFWRGMCA